MRKKSKLKSALIFFLVIFVLLSIPLKYSMAIKGKALEMMSPLWRWAVPAKKASKEEVFAAKIEKLNTELRDLSLEKKHLLAIIKEQQLGKIKIDASEEAPLGQAISAKVIYRSPLFWSNFIIVDAGENLNLVKEKPVISKGSPVIAKGSLVGVVDYVGARMSRIKLITDEGLQPSVRVARGKPKAEELLSLLERVILSLESIDGHDKDLMTKLQSLYAFFKKESDPLFLAKGIVQGQSQPLWRSATLELNGIGFNYDFSDEEGPLRDLLTGKAKENEEALPLIKSGDLLVTSGLDGVFQEGIPVAIVKSIDKLKEGDFYFSLKAIPCIDNLGSLTDVFILPSRRLHEESLIR